MCGIHGELSGIPRDFSATEAATERLFHRGPDEHGSWRGANIFLAMRRLSIIDLSGGTQPIWNENRTCCIVFNGEIYNFEDLRSELIGKGHTFATRSDTEVVLHAYDEWGTECLQRLNGMFAIAIWDVPRQRLFLARDRIGEKPLYYFDDGRRLIFASEIKAILADSSVPRELNPRGLVNFLSFGHAIAPDTIYRNIRKLLPGHYLLAENGERRVVEYWDVGRDEIEGTRNLTEAEAADRVLALLDDSVRRRMVADVPVGAFLSGGVDSSAIVALMKRHASGPVKTFAVGFGIGGVYNELADARRVAAHLGSDHHELNVEHLDLVQTLRSLVWHYDEPFGDPAGFPLYLVSKFAAQHVKVVLTGDGGDELFGGYRRYAADQMAPLYQRLPRALTHGLIPSVVDRLPRLRRIKRTVQTLRIADPAQRYAAWLRVFSPEMQAGILAPAIREAAADHDPAWTFPRYYHALNGHTAHDHLNRLMYVDLKTWLVDAYMEKADKATMAASIEARLPLLDHRLVELAFRIPGSLKIRGRSLKRILKRAVRDLVPAEVLTRPKHGFAVPTDPWFRGELRDWTFEVLLDGSAQRRGYFNKPAIEQLWRDHVEGRRVCDEQLWLLLNFDLWHRIYMEGEAV